MTKALTARTPREPGQSGPQPIEITEAGLAKIEQMAADGLDNITMAKALAISGSVFAGMKRKDDRVDMAYRLGRAALADELTSLLLTEARAKNMTAIIFLAKARCGWRDHGTEVAAGGGGVVVNISVPPRMSEAEFQDIIKVKPTPHEETSE